MAALEIYLFLGNDRVTVDGKSYMRTLDWYKISMTLNDLQRPNRTNLPIDA